ncbi:hypothetical protein CC80DRAFT_598892 [Byssothecium circinans]|uniref:Uncharacterized protein n=1 Tax=Byssothecium circinans TaxID=147558 RepID=A0A6A5TKE3_9PLEO|nr:hypothetical protein CC80DRAFT_598892 [Byssothecium circinans]
MQRPSGDERGCCGGQLNHSTGRSGTLSELIGEVKIVGEASSGTQSSNAAASTMTSSGPATFPYSSSTTSKTAIPDMKDVPQLDGPYDQRRRHSQTVPSAYRAQKPRRHHSQIIQSGTDHQLPAQVFDPSSHQLAPKPQPTVPNSRINIFTDILPYCILEGQLTEDQVINLSDLAGSLKEVMLLALQAREDPHVKGALIQAVGENAANGIVEFFEGEFGV